MKNLTINGISIFIISEWIKIVEKYINRKTLYIKKGDRRLNYYNYSRSQREEEELVFLQGKAMNVLLILNNTFPTIFWPLFNNDPGEFMVSVIEKEEAESRAKQIQELLNMTKELIDPFLM